MPSASAITTVQILLWLDEAVQDVLAEGCENLQFFEKEAIVIPWTKGCYDPHSLLEQEYVVSRRRVALEYNTVQQMTME
jgi:hypothetical protein